MLQYLHTIKSKAQEKTLFIPFTNVTFRKHQRILALMLIWVGFLGVCLEVVGGWGCLKLVRIMLETSNLAHKYTHM